MKRNKDFRCGYVTIAGRPNVGKSTLLNKILGQKISITSNRPQTTRWHLHGIKTGDTCQVIYVDTPGLQNEFKGNIHQHMRREMVNSLVDVDIAILMIEALIWSDTEETIVSMTKECSTPVLAVINKIDRITDKNALLPFIEKISEKADFKEIVPVSALKGDNIERVEQSVYDLLPPGPPQFPEDQISDRSERFFAAEFIREKLTRRLSRELPYKITVTIDHFSLKNKILHIHATIWVESGAQKKIVVGKNGAVLKLVGEQARKDMENMFEKKIFLQTWVKTRKKWTEDEKALRQFGLSQ